ncbi:M64 family metallopeptidase [Tenuifilum thalassicum]|nr:M64 family metallopeptidase [Tenuifilum thalassicum]
MRRSFLFITILFVAFSAYSQTDDGKIDFDKYFQNKTMRVDYLHSGTWNTETFSLFGVKNDGEWGGRVEVLNDPYNLGLYAFDIVDDETGKVLYTQGFCSVFGEWQTIKEARETNKTFEESIRFPWPKNRFRLVMRKRDSTNTFKIVWTETIDPENYSKTKHVSPSVKVRYLLKNGKPTQKVDIAILADGYSVNDTANFTKDAERFVREFFSVEPFKSRKSDFNVVGIYTISPTSGIRLQRDNFYPSNILGSSYYTFGIERYVLTEREWTVRDFASAAPYDFLVILLNSNKYGGGGIYNLYITASAKSISSGYVMVHEMGHHIAGLADEYYTSEVAYQVSPPKYEPWEFNVTALLDSDNLKWKNLVDQGTPIPTPWEKEEYEASGRLNKNDKFFGKVGAFEGASYLSKGMYRPEIDCIMFSHSKKFCKVCNNGLNCVIDLYVSGN